MNRRTGRLGFVARRVAGTALCAAGIAALLVPGPASAQTDATDKQAQINSQIDSLEGQVSEASAEESALASQIDAASATKKTLDAKVAVFDTQIAGVQRTLDADTAALNAAKAQQQAAEDHLASTQQALGDAKNKLANYAVAAYTGQSDAIQFITATLKSSSMQELVTKQDYMKAVGSTQQDLISADEHLRDQVKDLTVQLAQATQDAQAKAAVVQGQKNDLLTARSAQAAVQSQVAGQIATINSSKAQVAARKDEFLAQEAALQKQSDAITAQLQGLSPGSVTTGPPSAAGFIRPLDGNPPITSPFGYRVDPFYGTRSLHAGVDFGAPTGTIIHAAKAGTVVSAGWIDGYGNATIIDHGGGLATLYGHQSAFLVSAGQKVTQGAAIGKVGCTGACTGPHLHFEVRVNGTPVDPMPYLP